MAGACEEMPRPKVKKKKDVPNFCGASLSELGILAGLLPLLRSGALESLLSAGHVNRNASPAAKSRPLPKRNKDEARQSIPEQPGWKVVKRKEKESPSEPAAASAVPACGGTSLDKLQPQGFNAELVFALRH